MCDPDIVQILNLLLLTGARAGEILNAKWQDKDFERGVLKIDRSKSGKSREIILN
jgi:integrase